MSDLSISINELTYENQLDNFYKENKNMKQLESKDNVSEGSASSHIKSSRCYRFQQLKSHSANIRKADIGSKTSVSSSTATITKKGSRLSISAVQAAVVSKSNKWCVGQFICMPQRKLKQIPESKQSDVGIMEQNDDLASGTKSTNIAVNGIDDDDNNNDDNNNDDDAFLPDSLLDNKTVHDKNIELMEKLDENEAKLLEYENIINEMKQNKLTSLNNYEKLKALHDKQTATITELINKIKSLKPDYENQLKIKDDEIKNNMEKVEELQYELNKTNDKLQMVTLTEDLLQKQGNKYREEISKLKSAIKKHQDDYQLKHEEFNNYIDQKNKQHSENIKKVTNILDNYKSSQFENMEMHGDLEYIIGLVESSIVTLREEIETLKFENTEKTQIIENLMKNMKEKAVIDQNMENAVKLVIQEKIEAYYSLWKLSFGEKLNHLKISNTNQKLLLDNDKYDTKHDMEDIDDELNNIVGDILGKIDNEIEQTETPNAISVVCPPTQNNGVFELESVALEKLDTNISDSDVDLELEENSESENNVELDNNSIEPKENLISNNENLESKENLISNNEDLESNDDIKSEFLN